MKRLRFWLAMARVHWQLILAVTLVFGGVGGLLLFQAQRTAETPLAERFVWAKIEGSAPLHRDDGATRFHLQLRTAEGETHLLTVDQLQFGALDPERMCLQLRTYETNAPKALLAREDRCE